MYDQRVIIFLKNGNTIEGVFTDEFYEDESILISPVGPDVCIVKIVDIDRMELLEKD